MTFSDSVGRTHLKYVRLNGRGTPSKWTLFLMNTAGALLSQDVLADEVSDGAPTIPADHVLLDASGSVLISGRDGGGASIGWLHNIPGSVIAVAGDYETLDNAHWEYGSLSAALNTKSDSVFAEVDEGAGSVGGSSRPHHFGYSMEVLGARAVLGSAITVQLETRQIDVDTSHGNLPKFTLEYSWHRDWQTAVSYAKSVGGNLGTELATLRVDRSGFSFATPFVGGAVGHVAPPVVNFQPGQTATSPQYRELFLGATTGIAHGEWTFLLDYTSLEGLRRIALSLTCLLPSGRT